MVIDSHSLNWARQYRFGARLSVIPIKTDGTKAPGCPWECFQHKCPDEAQLNFWFGNGQQLGLAAICGAVSGNLEVLDIDAPELVKPFLERVQELGGADLLQGLVMVETPRRGAGRHLWYRCPRGVTGNQKLAWRQIENQETGTEERVVLIETRGEGGYALLPESPLECHPERRPYRLLQGSFDFFLS